MDQLVRVALSRAAWILDHATLFLDHAAVASGTIYTMIVDDAINSSMYGVAGLL